MHLDPMMMNITIVLSVALAFGYLAVRVGLPIVVAYIIAGIMLGPSIFGVISDPTSVARAGEIGVVMLLFFVGMEVSIPRLMSRWRIALIGTACHAGLSGADVGVRAACQSWRSVRFYDFTFQYGCGAQRVAGRGRNG